MRRIFIDQTRSNARWARVVSPADDLTPGIADALAVRARSLIDQGVVGPPGWDVRP